MKILITGASGFVGSHFINECLQFKDLELFGTYYHQEQLSLIQSSQKIVWKEVDFGNMDSIHHLVKEVRPDLIYHFAGMTFVPACEKDPDKAYRVNVDGFKHLLNAVQTLSIKTKVVTISTSHVYELSKSITEPLNEKSPLNPTNIYAKTKLEMEKVALRFLEEKGHEIVVFRPFNHIGPNQSDTFVVSSFAKQMAEIKKGIRKPIVHVGDLSAKRDFTDVRDIVRAYRLIGQNNFPEGIYNICSGRTYSIQFILDFLVELIEIPVKIQVDASRIRKNDLPILYGCYKKLADASTWSPQISIEQTLKDVLDDWMRKLS